MITDPWFYLAAVPAVLLFGIAKGGFGGGLGVVAVPLMALVVSPLQAAAVLLPILCLMDLVGLWVYRGKWLWMWPNWTLSLFDGGMNTSRINPLGPDRTELIYNFYFADTSAAARPAQEDTIARNIAVIEEDFTVCIETQKNYASGGYAPGPLSPRHEQGVAWFQNRVRRALGLREG